MAGASSRSSASPSSPTDEEIEEYEGDNEGLIFDLFPELAFLLEVQGNPDGCYICTTGDHQLCQDTLHLACQCFKNNHEEVW